ncbi:UCH-domain-containing protein [Apiospora rasikravindrae]|uniref:ubiquitinyl hydrolase 1 n=1 Tax=Apiospora rasikravindrae TaxID=990691 RepID=A0ABR1T7X3_9PEZI
MRSQLAAKTSSSKKRKISTRQSAKGEILQIRHSSPDFPIQSCETEIDPDPSLSFTSTTPIPPTGSRSPAYIRNDSVPPASSLPAHLQTTYSDYASSAASSPSAAYADLSINSDRGGDSAEPNSAGTTGHLDLRGSSPFAVKPSHHRAIMGGAADYPDRASSPLKRRASSMDPEADAAQTGGDQDVEMAHAGTNNGPEESSESRTPAQQDKNTAAEASPSISEPNGSQEQGVPSITMTEAPQPPQSIEGHIKSIRAFCEEMATRPLENGEQGYIVSKKWVTSVIGDERHAKHGEIAAMDASNVSPVDNSDIIWETIEDPTVGKAADVMKRVFVRLKPGLSITEHFEIFPSAAWELVMQWPGLASGQIPIVRTARNTSDNEYQPNIQFEVHPPVFTIHRLWSECSPKPVNQVLKAEPMPLPVKLARSSTCTWKAFLAQAKNVTDIPLKDRVQVWSIPRKLAAGAPDATAAPTPPASPSDIADPQNPQDSWAALLVSVDNFLELEDKSDRVKIEFRDVTIDQNYNGHMDLTKLGLNSDQTIVIDEHIEGQLYTNNYSPKLASASTKSSAARSSSTSLAVNRNARSGRTSPAPTAGPVTRGRAQKSGRTIGCTGLSNLGNTCYMNSALQCVRSVEELTKYFLSREWEKEINRDNVLAHNGDVAAAYAHLLHDIYKEPPPNSVTPRQFKNTLGRYAPAFSGYGQQDSQEFLGFLLDGLQEDLSRIKKKPYIEKPDSTDEMVNDPAAIREMAEKVWDITKKRDDSVIADLFTGLYKSTLVCPECQKVSITFDPFNNLTLPLPIENKWSHTIKYFPLNDRPVNIRVELDKASSIQMLKQYISDRTGVPPERLHGAEEWKGKFYKQYANGAGVHDEITHNDNAWIFELEAPPSNWNSAESQSLEGSTKGRRSMVEEAESPGSKVLESMLVPVIHRRPYASRSSYGYHKWSFACVPHFIIVTPEEARNEDIIRRKILQKVATFSDHEIFTKTQEEVDTSDNTEPEMVTMNGVEADPSIETKSQASKVKVTAQSVEGEDDMVDVTMQDAGAATAETPSGQRFNSTPPPWVDVEKYLQPELQNMFDLSYWTESGQLLANGMNGVTEDKDYPKLSSRMVDPALEDAPDNATNGTASNEDSSSDELSRPNLSNHQTRMGEESEEEDESPVVKVAHRPKPVVKGPGGRKKLKPRQQYGKGGKGKAGKKRMKEAQWKQQQQQEAEVEPQTPPEMPDSEAEAGTLIRLREGIVVDWSEDAYNALFGESHATWDQCTEMPDPALERARAARERRRKHGITLDNCLDEFERQEVLSENDMWYCPRCKKHQRATKKFDLWKTPDILVVHLKRFSSSGYRRDKLDVFVDFPLEGLDLTRRVQNLEDGKDEIYDLIGVDDHWGGLGGGHYTARARNFVDGQWYSYNDSSVSKTSPDKIVESSAYLLFYRRRSEEPLGGPRFKEIIENLDHPAAGEDTDESGEGQRLGEGSSPTGSPSAFQEQEAAAIPQRRLGTGGNGGLANGTQSDDDLPSLSKINFDSQGVQPSIEDEGIDVTDKPTHTSLASDWNFDSLLTAENMKPGHDSAVPGSPADSIATNEAQHESSGDEQLHSSRNTFSPETDMDIPGASHYELGPSTEGEPPAYTELPPPDSRAELSREDMDGIWDDKQNVLNVPAPGDQHSEEAAEIHLDEEDRNKMD